MLARTTGRVTKFGSCWDSTSDRLSEAIVLLGLLIFLQRFGPLNFDFDLERSLGLRHHGGIHGRILREGQSRRIGT